MSAPAPAPFPRLPYVLLGAMSLASFGGPFVILIVVRGGPSARWPPDRAIEWVAIALVFGLVTALFAACVSIAWWHPVARWGKMSKKDDGDSQRAEENRVSSSKETTG
jgi:hypothetical protein